MSADYSLFQRLVCLIDMEYLGGEVPGGASGPPNAGYLRHQRFTIPGPARR